MEGWRHETTRSHGVECRIEGCEAIAACDQDNEPCRLDADIGPASVSLSSYEFWAEFKDPAQFDCGWLFALDRGDEFRWWAVADGIVTATDDDGVTTMIPTFNLLRFVYWYQV